MIQACWAVMLFGLLVACGGGQGSNQSEQAERSSSANASATADETAAAKCQREGNFWDAAGKSCHREYVTLLNQCDSDDFTDYLEMKSALLLKRELVEGNRVVSCGMKEEAAGTTYVVTLKKRRAISVRLKTITLLGFD